MRGTMLATLRCGSRMRTLPFDPARQSLLWVGLGRETGPQDAWASLECDERGLMLRTVAGTRLVVPGAERALDGPVLVDCSEPMMVGIERDGDERTACLYLRPADERLCAYEQMLLRGDTSFVIGRGSACAVRYGSAYASLRHARVSYSQGLFHVQDLHSGNGTFVNGQMVPALQERLLSPGDVVQVLDLVMVVGVGSLLMNRPPEVCVGHVERMVRAAADDLAHVGNLPRGHGGVHTLYPAPWLSESMRVPTLAVDPPPQRPEEEGRPVLMRIGPSFLMGLGSVWMGADAVAGVLRGDGVTTVLPRICMVVAMLGGMVIWPLVAVLYDRRQSRRAELRRQERYASYLDGIQERLVKSAQAQEQTLRQRYRPLDELLRRAHECSPLLMSHAGEGEGFLCLRVGTCDTHLEADVSWPEHHFSLRDDPLWHAVRALGKDVPLLKGVPASLDVHAHRMVGVVGRPALVWEFLRGIVAQVCALYSYTEAKVALVCKAEEKPEWEPLSFVRHAYDTTGTQCLLALTPRGMERIDAYAGNAAGRGSSHLVVICTNPVLLHRSRCLSGRGSHLSLMTSVLVAGARLHDLPRECEWIVDLTGPEGNGVGDREATAHMFMRSDVGNTTVRFAPDILLSRERAWQFALDLSHVRLGTAHDERPAQQVLSFLELFEAGNVSHLNMAQRWARSDASRSLSVPVGVGPDGQVVHLDLHERADGPHGLIAGTTGSGKSELIVTLVLALSTCFSPDEVSFVLIDYKGGGLTDAFDNTRHRLPHLAGTITNLDGREIGRALSSLGGELVRRQEVLRSARDELAEATMDIHRYLSLYRQGVVSEPLPHLFLIADEFAELKQQEPAFMDELMSAARIGRSLGVHLILATQKPSGVVDDQIWSNARLKVALKVSDVADSREMIRSDEAARLTNPGSFRLLVGYDEASGGGQAAYAGGPYEPSRHFEPHGDDAVDLLDDEKQVVLSLRSTSGSQERRESELDAVVAEVCRTSDVRGMGALPLWLEPLPVVRAEEELARRYAPSGAGSLVAVLGEVDDPAHQCRHGLLVDFTSTANVLLLGTQGSDVEGLLRVALVSLARRVGPEQVWMYALDMGEGMLLPLEGLPHVGGVVLPGDDEGVAQLFRLVEEERERRRARRYGRGDGGAVLIALSNVALFLEAHPRYEDRLVALARDGATFGIHVLATADGVSSVRSRLRTCFDMVLPTMLGDEGDYAYVLGTRPSLAPPQQWRRGIVRMDDRILEFQGATLGNAREDEAGYVQTLARGWCEARQALPPPIPRLPAHVTYCMMGDAPRPPWLPIGYARDLVEPVFLTPGRGNAVLVVANDQGALESFAGGVLDALGHLCHQSYLAFDLTQQLEDAHDDHLVRSAGEAEELLANAEALTRADVVLVFGAPQTMRLLSPEAQATLSSVIARERPYGGPATVLFCESWRLAGVYEDWYRAASSGGCGVWVGEGFAEQTILRVPRVTAAMRGMARATDGFLVRGGVVTSVRLVAKASSHEG